MGCRGNENQCFSLTEVFAEQEGWKSKLVLNFNLKGGGEMGKFFLGFLLVSSCLFVGCASPHVMVMKDGTTIETEDSPKFDKKTGFYEFKTTDGKTVKANKDEVLSIQEK